MSSATSSPCVRAAATRRAEVVERAELRVHGVVAALGGADGPRAARGRRAPAPGVLFGPLRWVRARSGGWAAGRARRSPSPRCTAGAPRSRRTCRGAPDRGEAERGNISYQAPTAARSRSTTTASTTPRSVAAARSGWRAIAAVSAASSAASTAPTAAGDASAARPAPRARSRRRRRRAPTPPRHQRRALEQLAADLLLRRDLLRQALLPGGEVIHPGHTVYSYRPRRSTAKLRAPAVVGQRRHRRLAPGRRRRARWRSTAASASWPSVKMSASTSTVSPRLRLLGKRPPSMHGTSPSMTTRRASGTTASTAGVGALDPPAPRVTRSRVGA